MTGSSDGTARLWDANTGECTAVLASESDPVRQASFCGGGSQIVAAYYSGAVVVWDTSTREVTAHLPVHSDTINAMEFSRDGTLAVTASDDGSVAVIDTASWAVVDRLECGDEYGLYACLSPDGARIATFEGSSPGVRISVWDITTGARLTSFSVNRAPGIGKASISPDWSRVLACEGQSIICIRDLATGECRSRLAGHAARVDVVCFSPDGRLVASGDVAGAVLVWNAESGERVFSFPGHDGSIYCAEFSSDGKRLFTGGSDGAIRVWDLAEGRELAALQGHSYAPSRIALSPTGNALAAIDGKRRARVWVRTREESRYGVFRLREFWVTVVFALVFLWSLYRDRKYFMALDAKIAAKRAEVSS